jgi:cell division ATPase FtsA
VLTILANAESVLTKRQKELGVAVVNIGGATCSVLVCEEGDALHAAVLASGLGTHHQRCGHWTAVNRSG